MADESQAFLGTGWSFPPSFDAELKGVRMTSNQEDIEKSLEILLTTTVGERFLQPEYGCDLSDMVFDPQHISVSHLEDVINDAILFHEPRIDLDKIEVNSDPGEGKIDIGISYTILTTNTRYNFVYPFYITEGTSL